MSCNPNSVIKTMLELSVNIEEANSVIDEFTPHRTYKERLGFLRKHYPKIRILGCCDGKNSDPVRTDYEAILSAIINMKWR